MSNHDARQYRRSRTLLGGRIVFNDRQSTFDCMVRNISDGGAKLRVTSLLGIPRAFELQIKDYNEKFVCETVWRDHNELGVSFRRAMRRQGRGNVAALN